MKNMLSEFKKFAFKGNVIDMAVGVVIGAAFGKIVSSFVSDIITPLIGLLTGGVNFTDMFIALDGGAYATLAEAQAAGAATLNYGVFITAFIDFLFIAFAVFLFVKGINKLRERTAKPEPAAKAPRKCPYCMSEIPDAATRCPHCTSELPAGEE